MENTKSQALNPNEILISRHKRVYDLEERTYLFAKRTSEFTRQLKKNPANIEYIRQLIRSSASIGANFIECNESLGKKDFLFRAKICRKEAKETRYWLRLIDVQRREDETERSALIEESVELCKIFGAIVTKAEKTLILKS